MFDILEQFDIKKALKRALGGGLSGAAGNTSVFLFYISRHHESHLQMLAMVLQVLTLMVCLLLKNSCIVIDRK